MRRGLRGERVRRQSSPAEFAQGLPGGLESDLVAETKRRTLWASQILSQRELVWVPPLCDAPDVSVIVRCYDEPHDWRWGAVRSALLQEGVSVEVILVEDGGPMDYWPIEDQRVGHLRLPWSHGAAHARNVGLARARGEYCRVLDGDDELPPGALAAQVAALRRSKGAQIVFGELEPFGECAEPHKPWPQHEELARLWDGQDASLGRLLLASPTTLVPGPSALWRRSWAEGVTLPEDCDYVEDGAWYRLLLSREPDAPTARWVAKPVLRYRVRQGSMSGFGGDGPSRVRSGLIQSRLPVAQRLPEHERLARDAKRPLKLAILDSVGFVAGGAQWSMMQLAAHLDPRLIEARFFVPSTVSAPCRWLRQRCLHTEVPPNGDAYTDWLPKRLAAWGAEAGDTVWHAGAVTAEVRDVLPTIVGHLQSTHLQFSGIDAERAERYDGFVCVSRAVEAMAGHLPQRKVTIPSPVDTVAARAACADRATIRAAIGLAPEEVAVFWSGRILADEKRTDWLRTLADRLRGVATFVVAGSVGDWAGDPDLHRAELAAWSQQAGVIWLDGLWPWEAQTLAAACDVYLSTSAIEGLSLAMLEAMAAGLFSVVTRCGGVDEAIDQGVTGYVLEPDDLAGLESALRDAVAMPALERRRRGHLAQQVARARFDVREAARSYALWLCGNGGG